jgi:hypothetical protein
MSQGLFPIRPDDHHLHPPILLFAIHPICLVYACMRVVIGCAARAEVCSVLEAGDWHMADDTDFLIFDRGQDGTASCGEDVPCFPVSFLYRFKANLKSCGAVLHREVIKALKRYNSVGP